MQDINDIFQNHVLVVSLLACLVAQILKAIIEVIRHGKLDFKVMVGTGGMPSAHSALVTALACEVGQTLGWSSPAFAAASVFAIIVMYDAAGVRQAAGKQAKVLNQMMDEVFQEHEFSEARLKELLGHTPVQVIAGAFLGAVISLVAAQV
jgi:uncharacterized protein